MKTTLILRWSLTTKVTLFTFVIFLTSIWFLTYYASRVLREDITQLLNDQRFATVSVLASNINTELDDRLRSLEKVAEKITPEIISNPVALQTLLSERLLLQKLFNGGSFVTDIDGTAKASMPPSVNRIGVNFMERDHIAAALKEGKTTISKPAIGKMLLTPVVSMAAPIRDAKGKVIGAVAGVIDLSRPNFLDHISANHYGKTGGYLLVAPQHKLYVTGTDKKLIMTPTPAPGVNPLFDRYAQGYEGSGKVVDSRGVEVLSSSKQISAAGWFLVARIPANEAFAPIRAMQYRMWLAAVILTLLAGGLTWWLLKQQLAPVFDTLKQLSNISDSNLPVAPLPIVRQDEVGQLIGGFNRLLEALTKREEALKESEEKYRQLFQHQPAGFALHEIITDAGGLPYDYRFLEVNPAFEQLTGLKAIDVIGRTQLEVIPDNEPYWVEVYGNVALTGKSVTFENFSKELNKHFQVSAYSPEPRKFATVFLDITDRKQAEEEKLILEQQLQQGQKLESLGVLAGGIAHDFNNILTIIIGNCSLAEMDYKNAGKHIPDILKAAERAAALCSQMLAYAGKAQFVQVQVNLVALVDETIRMLKSSLPQNAEIKLNNSTDILPIKGDSSQLSQIAMNLIINASEAIGEAQGEIRVSLTKTLIEAEQVLRDHQGKVIPPGWYACLGVCDNGCGMDGETRQRIFEPFYTTKFTGRGLGMSAVLGIIMSHAGALQLFSQPDQGTTFIVYLPLQASEVTGEESAQHVTSTSWQGAGTVLLVEDEEQIKVTAKAMLKKLGFTVIEAANGKEALELYHKNAAEITFVVTDMGMPVMDGYELFRGLKRLNPELPIIISSGFGDSAVTLRIPRQEIAALVRKPYDFEQLREVLRGVLDGVV